jgi:hypothetical protein
MNRVRTMIVFIIMWMIFDIWIHSMSPNLYFILTPFPLLLITFPSFGDESEWARELMIRGHTIASHTWSHTDMTTLTYAELHNELARVEQALIRILGKKPLYVCNLPPHLPSKSILSQVSLRSLINSSDHLMAHTITSSSK